MIPRTAPLLQASELTDSNRAENWQQQLSQANISLAELLSRLELPLTAFADNKLDGQPNFPLRVPAAFIAKMQKGNPRDPLLLQVLPQFRERLLIEGYSADPLAEQPANPVPGLLHKYRSRALLVTTSACAVHCRYCFRQHFPYSDNRRSKQDWQAAIDYIAEQPDINEVILSGGDPLANSDAYLDSLLSAIEALPQIKRIRWHSRLPVVLPDRVNPKWLARIAQSPKRHYMVIHSNHAQELGEDVAKACQAMSAAGIGLMNQSVLLAGVNDRADTLVQLSERLDELGVRPYYLHVLDKVSGAAHFDISEVHATALMAELQKALPGFLVPILTREEGGKAHKTRINHS